MPTYYAGIGSRETPQPICALMTEIATALERMGYILRSGHAKGADISFEKGVIDPRNKEIYLPWAGFNGSPSQLYHLSTDAYALAEQMHPNWPACNDVARKMHTRNMYQVLGEDLQTPVKFVVCWTEDGGFTGGTAQAMRLAHSRSIPIYNIHNPVIRESILAKIRA